MSIFHRIPAMWTDGVLTKSYVSTVADNRRYFLGLCDRMRCVPEGVETGMAPIAGASGRQVIWRGWFHKRDNNDTLTYRYNAAGAWVEDTVDVSGLTDNQIYYAEYVLRENPDKLEFWFNGTKEADPAYTAGTAQVVPPFCDFNGDFVYVDGRANFVDGAVSDPSHFDSFENNDFYNEENIPRQYPGMEVHNRAFDLGQTTTTIWTGYVKYDSRLERWWYRIGIQLHPAEEANSANAKIEIVLDPDGIAEVIGDVSASMDYLLHEEESSHDVVGAFVNGTWYKVICRLSRGNADDGASLGYFHYLFYSPDTPLSGILDPGEFTVGAIVYGDSTPEQLEHLATMDHLIQAELSLVPPQDWAVRFNQAPGHTGATEFGKYGYYFVRIGETLYYKGQAVKLVAAAGGRGIALPDSAESMSAYDLNGIKGLHYGMIYALRGMVEFAMEV